MKTIPKGTIIVVKCSTGYCGMDSEEYYKLTSDYTSEQLDDFANSQALENAEMYDIYPDSKDSFEVRNEDDEIEEYCEYSGDNIEGYWEIVPVESLSEVEDYINYI